MEQAARAQALRMMPYGVMVLTAAAGETAPARAATVHWAMQTSFAPPMLAVALPPARLAYQAARETGVFLLHLLGKGDRALAIAFARDIEDVDDTLCGHAYQRLPGGLPLLGCGVGVLECRVRGAVEMGDHHVMVCDVGNALMRLPRLGVRWDGMILRAEDMGERFEYAG